MEEPIPWRGDRLRQMREGAGMTRQELARACGLTRDAIYKLETGAREPTWGSLQALKVALGLESLDPFGLPPDPAHRPRGPGPRKKAQPTEPPPPKRPRGRPRKEKKT